MAIYHLNLKTGSKGSGKSAGAKSDYIMREGKYKSGREELLTQIHGNLPSFAENEPSYFWKSADKYEAENGRLYIQIEFALPRELNNEQQIRLAQKFADEICNTDTYNLPYTLAIHKGEYDHKGRKSKSEPTPHAHLIISERGIDNIDRTAEVFFKRANSKNPAMGGAKKVREVKSKEWLENTRELWANLANQALERAGFDERIDHRTLKAQKQELEEKGLFEEAKQLDREPQKKRFWNIDKFLNEEIEQEELKELSAEELSLIEEITKIDNEISKLEQSEIIAKTPPLDRGENLNDLLHLNDLKHLDDLRHLDDLPHLNDLEVNYEISENSRLTDSLRDLPTSGSNENTAEQESIRGTGSEASNENLLPSNKQPSMAAEQRNNNAGMQPLGESRISKNKTNPDILETKFISFTQEYNKIQGKELSEISKTTLRKSFAQEYEKGGEKAVDEYISSYLTSLKNRKEKAEYEKQKAEFIESKLIDFAKKFEEIAQKKLVKELLIEPLGTEYDKGGVKAVDDYISNYLTDFENNKKKAEEEAKKRAEAEAKAKAQEEARAKQLAEQEAKRKKQEEAKKKAEEEIKAKFKNLENLMPSERINLAITSANGDYSQLKRLTEIANNEYQESRNKHSQAKTASNDFYNNFDQEAHEELKRLITVCEEELNEYDAKNAFSKWITDSAKKKRLEQNRANIPENKRKVESAEEKIEQLADELESAKQAENNAKLKLSAYAEALRQLGKERRGLNFVSAEQQEKWERETLQFLGISIANFEVVKAEEQLNYYATHQAELEQKQEATELQRITENFIEQKIQIANDTFSPYGRVANEEVIRKQSTKIIQDAYEKGGISEANLTVARELKNYPKVLEPEIFECEKLSNPFAQINGITLNEAKELKQLSERLFKAIKSEVFRQKTGSQTFQEENTRQFAEGTVRNAYFIGGGGKNGVNVAKRAVENEIRKTPEKVRQLVLSLKKERVLTR